MRLQDFLTEDVAQLDNYYQASLNGALTFPDMDQYYELYRFSILTASAGKDGIDTHTTNVLRDHPMTVGYSEAEQKMILDTARALGKDVKELTSHGSHEPKDTGLKSPVAQRRELWDLYESKLPDPAMFSKHLDEGWKEKAGALATAACIAGTPGCATTNEPGSLLTTLNAVGRLSQVTKAGIKGDVSQELRNIARGDANSSHVLRSLKKTESAPMPRDKSHPNKPPREQFYAIYANNVPTVKYNDKSEAEKIMASLARKFPEVKYDLRLTENYGKYWCSTDKRWKYRQSPKQKRKVNEGTMMPDFQAKPMKGGTIFPDMDQYYELYRFSLAMAQAGNDTPGLDPRKDLADAPMTLSYSDADERIVQQAAKKMGKKGKRLTTPNSEETNDINKTSPVAQRKELKDLYK